MARGNRIISKTQDQASGRESEDRPVKAAHTHTHKAAPRGRERGLKYSPFNQSAPTLCDPLTRHKHHSRKATWD